MVFSLLSAHNPIDSRDRLFVPRSVDRQTRRVRTLRRTRSRLPMRTARPATSRRWSPRTAGGSALPSMRAILRIDNGDDQLPIRSRGRERCRLPRVLPLGFSAS